MRIIWIWTKEFQECGRGPRASENQPSGRSAAGHATHARSPRTITPAAGSGARRIHENRIRM
ncbi:MAG: hypothetical protein QUU85_14140 [Candidatus Eisenbacteria bacterium]|nr:hypothetical protein [Candidatus Eisenbacteria bacterium]